MAKRILILGATGQLGSALSHASSWPPDYQIIPLSHSQFDITHPKLCSMLNSLLPFHCLINAAVFMPVDACEKDPEKALQTNGMALLPLAQVCQAHGALLAHFSTDYVFDGRKGEPYGEDDYKKPLNVYGRSKYMGELILESIPCPHILLRSSWIFSPSGQNFVKKVWEWSGHDREVTIVNDQVGCPTFADDLVTAVIHMVTTQLEHHDPQRCGTFHVCGKGEVTWYEYANFILDTIAAFKEVNLRVSGISSQDYQKRTPGVADRPEYSVLACEKIREVWGVAQKDWRESVQQTVQQLFLSTPEKASCNKP